MKKTTCVALLATVALCATTAANAGSYSIAGYAKPTMTYTTVTQAQNSVTSGYSGVGSLFISYASTATTGYGSLCSGALINSSTVLTAAHCVSNYTEAGAYDPVTSISYYLPSFGAALAGTAAAFTASDFAANPLYDNATALPDGTPAHGGDIGGGHDEALVSLSTAATGYDTYSLYLGDPLKQYTEVGTGTIGGPKGTDQGIADDYLKRTGSNIFEAYGSQVFSDVTDGVVLSDFDDGTSAHDVLGAVLGINQTGVNGEADSSPGDSGGPEFINGQIAATTSFGITGGIFMAPSAAYPDGYCGGNSLDPYNANGSTKKTSVDSSVGCTNSSIGELAGDTLVSNNIGFINGYLGAHGFGIGAVPEPSSWAMMLTGFGAVGVSIRRRKPRVSFG